MKPAYKMIDLNSSAISKTWLTRSRKLKNKWELVESWSIR